MQKLIVVYLCLLPREPSRPASMFCRSLAYIVYFLLGVLMWQRLRYLHKRMRHRYSGIQGGALHVPCSSTLRRDGRRYAPHTDLHNCGWPPAAKWALGNHFQLNNCTHSFRTHSQWLMYATARTPLASCTGTAASANLIIGSFGSINSFGSRV